jgi:hypothetical protein
MGFAPNFSSEFLMLCPCIQGLMINYYYYSPIVKELVYLMIGVAPIFGDQPIADYLYTR